MAKHESALSNAVDGWVSDDLKGLHRRCNIGMTMLRHYAKTGELETFRVGKKIFATRRALEKLLDTLAEKSKAQVHA